MVHMRGHKTSRGNNCQWLILLWNNSSHLFENHKHIYQSSYHGKYSRPWLQLSRLHFINKTSLSIFFHMHQLPDTNKRLWISFNTLRPRRNRCHFADDILKCIFFYENVRISIKVSLKFVPKDPINNIPALVQIRAWRRPGDKPLSEPMMVCLLTHICVTRSQWVNISLN